METEVLTNVAKQSTEGHFVKNAKVVCINEIREAHFVEGDATLVSKNHQTIPLESNCLIMPQQVYNPFEKKLRRSQD